MYFKLCQTYFELCRTYFLPRENCIETYSKNADKIRTRAAVRGTERGYARQPPLLRRDESRLKHDQSDKKNLKRTSGPNRLAVQRKRLTFDPGIGTY